MRAALISIELFALYILENTPQLSPEAGGVKPLFLVAAALSLTSDEVTAATIYGAVCGVLTDLESGAVGFFAVTLTVLCYFQSTLLHTAFRRNLPSVWSRRGGFFRGFCNTACFRHGGMAAVPDTCGADISRHTAAVGD